MNRRLLVASVLIWATCSLLPSPAQAFHAPPWDTGHQSFQPDPGDSNNTPGTGPGCNNCPCTEKGMSPVEAMTGNFTHALRTVAVRGVGPAIDMALTYHSQDRRRGAFGVGWVHPYDQHVMETTDGVNVYALCSQPDGKRERFSRNPDGSYSPPPYVFATLSKAGDGSFTWRDKYGTVRRFGSDGRMTALLDRNGNAVTFFYDGSGFLAEVRDAAGRSVRLVKGADGRVASLSDPLGRTYAFGYDAAGNLTSYTDPLVNASTYQYDGAGNLTAMIDPRGNTLLRVVYDASGRVNQHVDGATTWTYTYTPASKRTTKRDTQNRTWTFDYNDNGNITRIVDPLNRVETYVLGADMGVLQFTDKNAHRTSYTYDAAGNQLTITDAAGNTRRMTYDAVFNLPLTIQDAGGNTSRLEYDGRGNLTRSIDALGNAASFSYDSRGLLIRVSDPLGHATTLDYDADGNLVQTTDPAGNVNRATFDRIGRVESVTDGEGRTTRFAYDGADRLIRVSDASGQETVSEFDASGNLTRVGLPNGSAFTFAYDALNRRVQETNALGQTIGYGYDLRSNVTTRQYPSGQTVALAYDVLDRLIRQTKPSDTVNYTYDGVGNLLTATNNDSGLTFTYDVLDRTTQAATSGTTSQPATTLQYTYDANGRRLRMTDSAGGTLNYAYDANQRLISMTDAGGDQFTFAYDAASRRIGTGRPLGLTTAYAYDEANRLTTVAHAGTPGPLSFAYAYDRVGSRVTRADAAGVSSYTFDALARLTRALPPPGITEEVYAYNAIGNRVSSHLSSAYTYNTAGRLTNDATFDYTYDANGNLTQSVERATGRATIYSCDIDNRITQIRFPDNTTATYRYDALGRRITKTIGTQVTRYVYDGADILLEYSGTTLAGRYTHGPGVDEILSVRRGTTASYAQTDALGTVIRTVSSSGATASYQYDSFGRILSQAGTPQTPYAFSGREFDAESGLYYYRARYYDPRLGRFISEDPNGIAAGMNLYAYAANNPGVLRDPSGEFWWVAAGAVIGAAVNVGITYVANGGHVTGQQLAAAAVSGAISGALGAVAGPLGGTIARGLGAASNGLLASAATAGLSGGAAALGQAAANAIDPCHATNPLDAALWGGIGGGASKYFFPTRNLNTWAQAQHFGPSTFSGLFGSNNAWLNLGSFGTASGVGAASNFPALNPVP
jgi:RHS repeat-associated protein